MTDMRTRAFRDPLQVARGVVYLLLAVGLLVSAHAAHADTMPVLFSSFAGNVDFAGTEQTLRTHADSSDSCTVVTPTTTTSANLSGIPDGAVVRAAYLYWAGSSVNITTAPDYDVVFEGNAVSAPAGRRYTAAFDNGGALLYFFSGVADVTAQVSAKGNGSYAFSGLSVNAGAPHCGSSAVVGGWAMLVVYAHPDEDFRVLNVFEGFQIFRGSSIMLRPDNFRIPTSPINGKHAYITWEGDPGNSGSAGGYYEGLSFNGSVLSDAVNPAGNQFNSVSNMRNPVNTASYGVDFDVYDISALLAPGDTSATSIYSSGGDLVLLSSEIISVTNTAVADLGLNMTRNTALSIGKNASYTISVTNHGPGDEPGPVVVTDILPSGLSFVSGAGSGWSCSASGQLVSCSHAGGIANGSVAPPLTLTAGVSSGASWTRTNTATVTGTAFDNVKHNNTVADTYVIAADLAVRAARSGTPAPGNMFSYLVSVGNLGHSDEPGPVTISGTLPPTLSYLSGSGGGWSCSASGQTFSCIRPGSLQVAATSQLMLSVRVAANASGAIINTVTVAGTEGLDGNSANNAATDSFVFTPYAYYAMDEVSWTSGTVIDSSGNLRHGTIQGSTSATGYPPSVGSAIAGNPGTCGAGAVLSRTGNQGVLTPIDINDLGNAGTIAFWYRSSSAWMDGVDRMLLDASSNAGNGNADKHFYLVKSGWGQLRFGLEDSADDNVLISSGPNNFGAGQWHHIAIAWDWNARRIYLFLDGAQAASTMVNENIGNYSTLLIGAAKNGIQGTDSDYTSNSATGHVDEVYVYDSALDAAGVASVKSLTHACASSVHHYEVSVPETNISCLPATLTVIACADASSPCANRYTAAGGQLVTLATSAGTLGAATLILDANGMASTTLSHPSAVDGAVVNVTLSGEQLAAYSPRQCCPNGSSCFTADHCPVVFNTAGFIIADAVGGMASVIPPQVAGVSSTSHILRAVRTNTSTKACEGALVGLQQVGFAYECNDPGVCYPVDLMSASGGTSAVIARNNNGNVVNYTQVDLHFDANGNAPFTFNYGDVGRTTLRMRKTAGGALLSDLLGSTNTFTTKPYSFVFTNIRCTTADAAHCASGALAQTPAGMNPAASDAGGASFIPAGSPFSATVTAVALGGNPVPSYGRESSPQGIVLKHDLFRPATGNPGSLGGTTTIEGSAFSSGSATASDLSWNEAGIITLAAEVKGQSYLDAGNVTASSGNIGRFIPHHFDTVVTGDMLCPAGLTCPAQFNGIAYSGQSFDTSIAARSAGGGKTANYDGALGFAKAVTLAAWDGAGSLAALNPNAGVLGGASVDAIAFASGEATTLHARYALPNPYPGPVPPPGPTDIYLRASDADGVTSLRGAPVVEGGITIVSGRIWITNAHGSELLRMPMSLTAQYWNGTGYVRSETDNSTSFAIDNVMFSDWQKLAPASAWGTGSTSVLAPAVPVVFTAGRASLTLAAPGEGKAGSVRLTTNGSAAVPGTADYLPSNTARATFGVYRGNNRFIYMRENY